MAQLLNLVAVILVTILRAFTLTKLWTWYVLGVFSSVELGMVRAYGLCMLVQLATYTIHVSDLYTFSLVPKDKVDYFNYLGTAAHVFICLSMLAIGYACSFFL